MRYTVHTFMCIEYMHYMYTCSVSNEVMPKIQIKLNATQLNRNAYHFNNINDLFIQYKQCTSVPKKRSLVGGVAQWLERRSLAGDFPCRALDLQLMGDPFGVDK